MPLPGIILYELWTLTDSNQARDVEIGLALLAAGIYQSLAQRGGGNVSPAAANEDTEVPGEAEPAIPPAAAAALVVVAIAVIVLVIVVLAFMLAEIAAVVTPLFAAVLAAVQTFVPDISATDLANMGVTFLSAVRSMAQVLGLTQIPTPT